MMAQDSRKDEPSLSAETIAELTAVLGTFVREQRVEHLQRGLQRVAVEARERHIHAERLVLALKDIWYALPELKRTDGEEQTRLLQRVVSTCIREYYGG